MFHTIEEAVSDLIKGKPILVVDDENRENEGDFVALSEMATPEIINFMITHGKGLVCTTMKEDLANKLGLSMMTNQNTDPFATAFTVSIDHKDSTTGISAKERSRTIQALTDPGVSKSDFLQPGHVFPLIAKDGGVLKRPGHTEASVDLAELSGSFPSSVICEVIKENGEMARVPDLIIIAEKFDLKIISIEDLIAYRKTHENLIEREIETSLPSEFGSFRILGYTNKIDKKEHIALVKGDIDSTLPTLVRIHSECLTGDIFGSYRCDCGPQLHEALAKIEAEGNGVLVYMRQEGRGIGLINKLRAYKYQDEGMDTVEANTELGFAADLREYDISAQILLDLGIEKVNLLTNNPQKMNGLEAHGITIEKRIPIQTEFRNENKEYMVTKSAKLGHLLSL